MEITNKRLWYKQPAREWTDSLPLGNGRIGAMIFGGTAEERIALNEDTLWSGYPHDKNNHNAAKHLQKARELANAEKFDELTKHVEGNMLGDYTESYMPLGDMLLTFPQFRDEVVSDYYRDLDLDEAVSHTSFTYENVRYERECFVSYPKQALVMKIKADKPAQVDFDLTFKCRLHTAVSALNNQLFVDGLCPSHVEPSYIPSSNPVVYESEGGKKGMRFYCIAEIQTVGGNVYSHENMLTVEDADEAVIIFTVRTSYNGFQNQPYLNGKEYKKLCFADNSKLTALDYNECKAEHIAEYKALFDRVDLHLEKDDLSMLSTDERLKRFVASQDDKGLYELIFQYGRYLLISGSRQGTQAANLQGIWNQELRAPWSANYTLNINTEMNYWLAESCNLSECHEPLFDLIDKLTVNGSATASLHYGAKGVTSHHNSDIWGMTNPVGRTDEGTIGYAYWCMSYGWLCQHLFRHYEYTLDEEFLKNKALPALTKAAEFYLSMLTENKKGELTITPSTSPENAFVKGGRVYKIAKATTMTNAIVKEVFTNYLKCCSIVGSKGKLTDKITKALEKLPPYRVGKRGNLMEWDEDYDDAEVTHRHISHLYALYPGDEITPAETPELADACRKALEIRGDDGTGWSLGWKINTWARLRDGNHAEKLLKRQLRFVDTDDINYGSGGGTYRNLFDAHPPFQIDGNFAASAGIAEMLLQNEGDTVVLLPALPSEWTDGYVKGLCAKGGVVADIYFEKGQLAKAVLHIRDRHAEVIKVRYKDTVKEYRPQAGENIEF